MKREKAVVLLSILAAGVALFFAGCNDRGNINGPGWMNFDVAQFAFIDYTDVQNAIEDGTVDNPMIFNSTMLNYSVMGGDRMFGPGDPGLRGMPWFDRFDFAKHLGRLFRALNLSDAQKTQVRDLARTFHESMRPLVRQFHEANKAIIEDANAKRKLILDDLKAGKLTREEARIKIGELNQATRDKINANPASQTIKTSMCAERDKFFSGVKGILTGEQVTKWDDWIGKIKDPCVP